MSLLPAIWRGCLYVFARASVIAAAATLAAFALRGVLASPRRKERLAAWGLLLVPYLAPALLVGYGWSGVSLRLLRVPAPPQLYFLTKGP